MFDVVCVGNMCADILLKPVNEFPEKGKLELIDMVRLQIGGCASNSAIDLARIGINTALIAKVGADGFGSFLKEFLELEHVDISGLKIDKTAGTSTSVVAISDDGERSILHCMGVYSNFSLKDIDLDIVKNTKVLFIAGIFLMPMFDGYGAEELLKMAKSAGVICCMDTAWDSTGQWMRKIEGSLKYLDWFMPSLDEAVKLAQEESLEGITDFFAAKGVKNSIIKLGAQGCYVRPQRENGFFISAYENIKVVDTSGAGDSFCAGFITGLVKGWDLKTCAEFANAVGAHCVMKMGTTSGIKPMKEILEFMKIYKRSDFYESKISTCIF